MNFLKQPAGRPVIIALAVYIVLTIVSFCNMYAFSSASTAGDWWLSLTTSFIVNLIFFITVGIALAIYQQRDPKSEPLTSRADTFLNGTHISAGARSSARRALKHAGAYLSNYRLNITYSDPNESLGSVKMLVQSERVFRNMFKDEPFEDLNLKYEVYTDQVGDPGTLQGQIVSARVVENGSEKDYVLAPIDIIGKSMEGPIPVSLPPDGEVTAICKYWAWHKLFEPYSVNVHRFTDNLVITITNNCNVDISIQWGTEPAPIRIAPDGRREFTVGPVQPGSRDVFTLLDGSSSAHAKPKA